MLQKSLSLLISAKANCDFIFPSHGAVTKAGRGIPVGVCKPVVVVASFVSVVESLSVVDVC